MSDEEVALLAKEIEADLLKLYGAPMLVVPNYNGLWAIEQPTH